MNKLTDFTGVKTGFKNTIEQLHKLKDIDGISEVIKDMASQRTKFVGGKFMISHIESKGVEYIKKIEKFECIVRQGENFSADVIIKQGSKLLHLEYKSWAKGTFKLMKDKQFLDQFKNYIKDGNFEYIFDKYKLLGKVSPNPDIFVKKEFLKILNDNAKDFWKTNENFFKKFKNANGESVEDFRQFEKLLRNNEKMIEQLNKYIKVE